MTNLSIEIPDDSRSKTIINILEEYNVDYLRYYSKTICHPNRIKFILFQPRQLVIDEILEYVKSEYEKIDFIHQSSFQLTDNERKVMRDFTLK
jgi:hypothetical protein